MLQVNLDEIKRDISTYIQRIESGETLIILRSGKPIAEIKPIITSGKKLRPFGLCAGEFAVPDNFDDPLPESIINEFEGYETSS